METLALSPRQEARFWAKVDKSGSCWEWAGARVRGYGVFRLNGQMQRSHRVSYQIAKGDIAAGKIMDHACRNRGCVNPDHLRVVTYKENAENVCGAQKNSQSGVLGVSWSRNARAWRADVTHNGKQTLLGYFATAQDAEAVVVAKRNELFTHNDRDRQAIGPVAAPKYFRRRRPTVLGKEVSWEDINAAQAWGLTLTEWFSLTDFERSECRRNITTAPKFEVKP